MSPRIPVLLLSLLLLSASAQAQDSLRPVATDTMARNLVHRKDSLVVSTPRDTAAPRMDSATAMIPDSLSGMRPRMVEPPLRLEAYAWEKDGSTPYGDRLSMMFRQHPYAKLMAPATRMQVLERRWPQTDWIFYLFASLCIFLGFLRLAFPKYMNDLFRVFFNTSLRGKQIREQLLMDRLPSLLLNVFFGLSAGVFLYFLLRYLGYFGAEPSWAQLGSCVAGVILLYGGKYVLVELAGLIFDRRQAAEIYSFVVFMVNKMAGLWLLPAGLLLAYASSAGQQTVVVFTLGGLALLVLYRLNRGYMALHNTLKINILQYLLFVAAFEVVPVLLIYKLLIKFF